MLFSKKEPGRLSQMRKGTPWANDVKAEKSRVVVANIVFLICRLLFVGERYGANAKAYHAFSICQRHQAQQAVQSYMHKRLCSRRGSFR
jgi:hypothetical protein